MNIPTSNNTTTDDSTETSSYNIKHIAFLFFVSRDNMSESDSDNFINATEYAVYDLKNPISIPISMYDTIKIIKNSILECIIKDNNEEDNIEIIPCKKEIVTNQEGYTFTNFKKLNKVIADQEEVDTIVVVIFPEDYDKLSNAYYKLISSDKYETVFNKTGFKLIRQIIDKIVKAQSTPHQAEQDKQ